MIALGATSNSYTGDLFLQLKSRETQAEQAIDPLTPLILLWWVTGLIVSAKQYHHMMAWYHKHTIFKKPEQSFHHELCFKSCFQPFVHFLEQ